MPPLIPCDDEGVIDRQECAEALRKIDLEPSDPESMRQAAMCLRRLGNDRGFLGDIVLNSLKNWHRDDGGAGYDRGKAGGDSGGDSGRGGSGRGGSFYGPQSIMLSGQEDGFFLRANIWPSQQDSVFRLSGAGAFAYEKAHDHNFDFLTLGYFGPGYISDYYTYDHQSLSGWIGEKAHLHFTGRRSLGPGEILQYRAHHDVHSQLPPQSLSVSLNIMMTDPAQNWRDQYGFDVERDAVNAVLSPTSTEVFLRLAVGMGEGNALDLAEQFGRHHPSDRIRLASFEARSMLCAADGERDALWRQAEESGSRLLTHEARRRRAELGS